MFDTLSEFTNLSPDLLIIVIATSFAAGLVRGFSGFALSAVLMAVLSNFIPPIQMVPICLCLEVIASMMMMRDGARNADMGVVWGLVIGSVIGTPIGYFILTQIDAETSRIVALTVITSLALLLLMKVKAKFLNTKPGLYVSGAASGMANIASVAGMVVALYVLAREKAAAQMRGTLVMYLMISLIASLAFQIFYGIFTFEAVKRAAIMTPFVGAGIVAGAFFFRPSLEKYYKPFCLAILIAICVMGLARQMMG